MGQPPQNSQNEQSYYSLPTMQVLDPSQELDLQSHPWMMATMIEDDDLTFGGKPLSTWYEEDRRRYSLGEESAPTPGFEDEEERRGRQRVSAVRYRKDNSQKLWVANKTPTGPASLPHTVSQASAPPRPSSA